MANASLSRVNQKLAYARALLKRASVSGHPTSAAERLQLQALLDAVVFHLAAPEPKPGVSTNSTTTAYAKT